MISTPTGETALVRRTSEEVESTGPDDGAGDRGTQETLPGEEAADHRGHGGQTEKTTALLMEMDWFD